MKKRIAFFFFSFGAAHNNFTFKHMQQTQGHEKDDTGGYTVQNNQRHSTIKLCESAHMRIYKVLISSQKLRFAHFVCQYLSCVIYTSLYSF